MLIDYSFLKAGMNRKSNWGSLKEQFPGSLTGMSRGGVGCHLVGSQSAVPNPRSLSLEVTVWRLEVTKFPFSCGSSLKAVAISLAPQPPSFWVSAAWTSHMSSLDGTLTLWACQAQIGLTLAKEWGHSYWIRLTGVTAGPPSVLQHYSDEKRKFCTPNGCPGTFPQ